MAVLQDILYKVRIKSVVGNTLVRVEDIQIDSRKVKPGTCFIAMKGVAQDGHVYIDAATAAGASVIVCENIPAHVIADVTYVQVMDAANAAGLMAHAFYGNPSTK